MEQSHLVETILVYIVEKVLASRSLIVMIIKKIDILKNNNFTLRKLYSHIKIILIKDFINH